MASYKQETALIRTPDERVHQQHFQIYNGTADSVEFGIQQNIVTSLATLILSLIFLVPVVVPLGFNPAISLYKWSQYWSTL